MQAPNAPAYSKGKRFYMISSLLSAGENKECDGKCYVAALNFEFLIKFKMQGGRITFGQ